MGKLHLVGGEKGGVGKSFLSRLLAQYHIDRNLGFTGFDTDQSHQTFSRFYEEFTTRLSVDDYESLDKIISSAENFPDRNVVVDLAAQTIDRLVLWLDDTELFHLMDELGFQTYFWHVMDDGADSVEMLNQQLQRYQNANVKFIIVLNEGRGEDFTPFEESSIFSRAAAQGAVIFELAKLQSHLARKIDFRNSSFWAAANNPDGLSTAERQRARVWLKWQYLKLDELIGESTAEQELPNNIITAKF